MYPDNYVLATLRRVGVPPMWLEDALQEVRIREWRSENTSKTLLHNWAVDAVRKTPGYNRIAKRFTDEADSLDAVPPTARSEAYPSDEMLDAERAINALPLKRRKAFALLAAGERPIDVSRRVGLSQSRIAQFRRQLREAAA